MPRADDPQADAAEAPEPSEGSDPARGGAASVGLADLSVAGLTRRRVGFILAALVAAWVIILFARQIGQASEASARAQAMRGSNAELAASVAALQAEVALIQRQAYIEQQARAYRLGTPHEIPFTLAANAPSLPPDAPGSSSVRLGAVPADETSPLDSWLRLLFGPGDPSSPAVGSGG